MFEDKLSDIAKCLINYLPSAWIKVIFHGEFDKTHYAFYYYVKTKDKYTQCFNMEAMGISRDDVRKCFSEIYDMCKDIDKEWNSFDLTINNDGKFKAEYNYDNDLQLDEWKSKYLI